MDFWTRQDSEAPFLPVLFCGAWLQTQKLRDRQEEGELMGGPGAGGTAQHWSVSCSHPREQGSKTQRCLTPHAATEDVPARLTPPCQIPWMFLWQHQQPASTWSTVVPASAVDRALSFFARYDSLSCRHKSAKLVGASAMAKGPAGLGRPWAAPTQEPPVPPETRHYCHWLVPHRTDPHWDTRPCVGNLLPPSLTAPAWTSISLLAPDKPRKRK